MRCIHVAENATSMHTLFPSVLNLQLLSFCRSIIQPGASGADIIALVSTWVACPTLPHCICNTALVTQQPERRGSGQYFREAAELVLACHHSYGRGLSLLLPWLEKKMEEMKKGKFLN
jgi:hypothetical protein